MIRLRVLPVAVCLLTSPAIPQFVTDFVYEIPSSVPGDSFSHSVAGLGDLDGDAVPDFAAGAPNSQGGGVVRVYSGASGGLIRELRPPIRARFGTRVRRAGDVDQDGVSDFLVGDPAAGQVILYSGSTFGVLRTHTGRALGFGEQLDGIGDVDLDGIPDVAIGDPHYPSSSAPNGRVTVFSGRTGAVIHQWTGAANDGLGTQVSAAGDWNNDGFPDVAVSADQAGRQAAARGYCVVYSGLTGSVIWTRVAQAPSERIGDAMRAGRDVSGDGWPELILGVVADAQHQSIEVHSSTRATYSLLSSTCSPSCSSAAHRFGFVGDVDADGTEDFAIALNDNSSWVFLFSGRAPSLVGILRNRKSGGGPRVFQGEIDGVGDLNGDGTVEVLVGGKLESNRAVGAVRVLSSRYRTLRGDTLEIAARSGGRLNLEVDAGVSHGGRAYWMLGSMTGIVPGAPTGVITVPLNPDSYTDFTIAFSSNAAFTGFRGNLDGIGKARASLRIPSLPSGLPPITMHHAYVVLDTAGGIVMASNAAPLRIR